MWNPFRLRLPLSALFVENTLHPISLLRNMLEVLEEDHEFDLAGSARIDVLVSDIHPKQASQIIKELSVLLPLEKLKLGHLKRIRSFKDPDSGKRSLQVLLSPPEDYSAIAEPKRQDIEKRYRLSTAIHAVPRLEPRTREQFEKGQSAWPMIFHHSTSEEARRAARVIPEQEVFNATIFMREALKDAQMGRQQADGRAAVGAVIVDSTLERVVAAAAQERQRVHDESPPWMQDHPLHHAVMLCVQQVGRAIVAGKKQGDEERTKARKAPDKGKARGERGRGQEEGTTRGSGGAGGACVSAFLVLPLMLGYSMALVHSRIRRVVYGVRDPERGCLGSLMMLHTVPALNHKYRVFEGGRAEECRLSLLDITQPKPPPEGSGSTCNPGEV